jgi:hypothetical protein
LRRLTLPASNKDDLQRLLALQIEAEFPLPPNQLAWGYCQVNGQTQSDSRAQPSASQEFIVAAVKREVVEEYAALLVKAGLNPVFTLAALSRNALCDAPPQKHSMLNVERDHSELVLFENDVPTAIRILPWGSGNLSRAIQEQLAISADAAEQLRLQLDHRSVWEGEPGEKLQQAVRTELDALANQLNNQLIGQKIYLTGQIAGFRGGARPLAEVLKSGVECDSLDVAGEFQSAAILGLKKSFEKNRTLGPLTLQLDRAKQVETAARPEVWKWAAVACGLALLSLSLRYAEPLIQKPRLSRQLAAFKAQRQQMPTVEKEVSFLQYLQTNHPPYLEAALAIANAAAPGTRIDTLSMNRRGELSFRGVLQNPPQATEFRSKLIDSGFFSSVVLEEQTPAPDRQRVTIRMSAQWKPNGARPSVTAASSISSSKNVKSDKPATVKTNAPGAAQVPPGKTEGSK